MFVFPSGGGDGVIRPLNVHLCQRAVQARRHKLATLNDPAVELKLAKHCFGESEVQHYRRMYGSDLLDTLHKADRAITDIGQKQGALGTRFGGMGFGS